MISRVLLLALGAASVALSGCVSFDQSNYPADWSEVVADNSDCSAVNGEYRAQLSRQTYPHPQGDQLLALTLLPGEQRLNLVQSVSLSLEDNDSLVVSGHTPGGAVLVRQHYRESDGVFDCYDGWLVFRPSKVPGVRRAPDNPVAGLTWSDVAFRNAVDGSLIMHETGGAIGLAFLLVPVYAETGSWYLFERVPTPQKQ